MDTSDGETRTDATSDSSPETHSPTNDPNSTQGENEPDNDSHRCALAFWHLLSWMWSIFTYLLEFVMVLWVSWFYASERLYPLFGLTLGYLALPTVVLMFVSLVWYRDLDRFYRRERQRRRELLREGLRGGGEITYKKKFNAAAVLLHLTLLGVVYR